MEIKEDTIAFNKQSLDKIEDILVDNFAIASYRINSKKVYNNINLTTQSTRNPQRSSALK